MKKLFLIVQLIPILPISALAQINTGEWEKEFVNPSNSYRPQPFWHMNGEMSEERLLKQMQNAYLKDGFGGVIILIWLLLFPTILRGLAYAPHYCREEPGSQISLCTFQSSRLKHGPIFHVQTFWERRRMLLQAPIIMKSVIIFQ